MLRPKALDHVGLTVADIDRTLRFYRLLGVEVLRRRERSGGVYSAVLRVGVQEINVFSLPAADVAEPGRSCGIDHFCLEMEGTSIDDVVAVLAAVGIDVAQSPTARSNGTSLFVHDPDGIRVELLIKT